MYFQIQNGMDFLKNQEIFIFHVFNLCYSNNDEKVNNSLLKIDIYRKSILCFKNLMNEEVNEYKLLMLNIINKETRNHKLYLKWKNVCLLKRCNFCKRNDKKLKKHKYKYRNTANVYYCSKFCQKRDWMLNH